jgi:hypothetical protein
MFFFNFENTIFSEKGKKSVEQISVVEPQEAQEAASFCWSRNRIAMWLRLLLLQLQT